MTAAGTYPMARASAPGGALRTGLTAACLALAIVLAMALGLARPASAAGAAKAEGDGPGILPVAEVVVPLSSRGRLSGYVMIQGAVEFADAAHAKSAEPYMPKIIDAWLRTVNGLSQRGHFDQASIDPELLKRQLLQATREAVAAQAPSDVLLTRALLTKN